MSHRQRTRGRSPQVDPDPPLRRRIIARHPPRVLRVQTSRGEATIILDGTVVEHVSPHLAWAIGWSEVALLARLHDLGWIVTPLTVRGRKRFRSGG